MSGVGILCDVVITVHPDKHVDVIRNLYFIF